MKLTLSFRFEKRARYDQFGHAGVDPSYGGGSGFGAGGFDFGDIGDIFDSFLAAADSADSAVPVVPEIQTHQSEETISTLILRFPLWKLQKAARKKSVSSD